MEATIRSVQEQQYNGEITHYLISDGAGRVETPASEEGRAVIFIERPTRGGPGAARNSGIRPALDLGVSHIGFVDDDDIWYPDFISTLLQTIDDYDMAYCDLKGKIVKPGGMKEERVHFSKDWGGMGSMKTEPYIPLPACLFRADFFTKYGMFREDIGKCVDWAMLAWGEAEGARYIHNPRVLGEYNWNFEAKDGISTAEPENAFPPTTWARIRTIISGYYI